MFFSAITTHGATINCFQSNVGVDDVGLGRFEDADLTASIDQSPSFGNGVPNARSNINIFVEGCCKDLIQEEDNHQGLPSCSTSVWVTAAESYLAT